jgi:hypothetical protein
MENNELQTIVSKHSQVQSNGCVLFDPIGANAITNILQKAFQFGIMSQKITQFQKDTFDLKKENMELKQKIYELENQIQISDRQLSDYDLLVNQLLRNTRNAEDRKRLAKIFVQHADAKNLKYDKGELLKIMLE